MSTLPAKDLRLELKFVTRDYNYSLLYNWLKHHPYNFMKEYDARIINNIYFDTLSFASFQENAHEHNKRFKIRYRWFNKFNASKNGFLEIKNKHNLYGWKNRFPIQDLKISDKGKWKNIIKKLTESVPDNVKILLKRYTVPVVINQYYRSYFVSNDKKFRITVDRYQKSFNQINSSSINISKNCDMSDSLVLEVKFNKKEENQVKDLLNSIPIKYSKNSKYVNAVRISYGL